MSLVVEQLLCELLFIALHSTPLVLILMELDSVTIEIWMNIHSRGFFCQFYAYLLHSIGKNGVWSRALCTWMRRHRVWQRGGVDGILRCINYTNGPQRKWGVVSCLSGNSVGVGWAAGGFTFDFPWYVLWYVQQQCKCCTLHCCTVPVMPEVAAVVQCSCFLLSIVIESPSPDIWPQHMLTDTN